LFVCQGQLRMIRGKWQGEWETHILPEEDKKKQKQVRLWAACMLGGHLLIIIACAIAGPRYWIIPLLTSFCPMYGNFLQGWLNNTQHIGLVDKVPDFRLCCRTIYVNPVFSFLYWHMEYHIEHHMFAGVPCYNLKRLHEAIKHDLPPICNGIVETWAEIIFIQRRQKDDPGFQYVQPLPGTQAGFNQLPVERTPTNEQRGTQADPSKPTKNSRGGPLRRWECSVCGFIYDEAIGWPEDGIVAGTAWEDIPDDWSCPDCGVAKADFSMVDITDRVDAAHATEADHALPHDTIANAPTTPLVIVGSGLAGYTLAKEIRSLGVERPITLITRDRGAFYSKPMLSNALAQGLDPDALVKETPEQMAQRFNLTVLTDTLVSSIDRERNKVIADEQEIDYGQLVLAVGADQITLPLQGTGVDRVHQVNDLDSYAAFRQQLPDGGKVLIIGGGLIGCEFANDLAPHGYTVHSVDLAPLPLGRLVPQPAGEIIRDQLTDAGVRWHLDTSVERVDQTDNGQLACTLANGDTITVDVVLSAVGLRPRLNLAQHAGLETDRGITVDNHLRTSDPDIFALGDCAQVNGQVRPYILPLFEGARALARTLSGDDRPVQYPVMPVVVKTPAAPAVVCPPPANTEGDWHLEGNAPDLAALYRDPTGKRLLGFALLGEATHRKAELVQSMTPVEATPAPSPATTPATA